MYGGFSNARGILLYNTAISKAVYGYYENDEIVLEIGTLKEMRHRQSEDDEIYEVNDHLQNRIVWTLFFLMLGLCVLSFFMFSFVQFLAVLLYCILSYMGFLVISFAWLDCYEKEAFEAFRRHHGVEHASIKMLARDENLTLENIETKSHFDGECGTAYAGAWVILVSIFATLFFHVNHIVILRVLLYTLIGFICLVINIFNPYNPLKLLQSHVVSKPTTREYLLALEVMSKLKYLEKKSDSTMVE